MRVRGRTEQIAARSQGGGWIVLILFGSIRADRGLAGGYLSFATGQEVYALEDRRVGKGDTACHVTLKSPEGWGSEVRDQPSFFKREGIHTALKEVAGALKRTQAAQALAIGKTTLHRKLKSCAMRGLVNQDRAPVERICS